MTTVGSAELTFEPVVGWPSIPDDVEISEAVGVCVDSRDRVYVFARGNRPLLVFEADGRYLDGWGEGEFVRPHGITIAADDTLYLVDDIGHSVRQYRANGDLLRTIGPSGTPSETGVQDFDYRTIVSGGSPYHYPTNLAVSSAGDLFVTDGYGNARVHRFSSAGELVHSWGSPGAGPGEFHVPHGIGIDRDDRLYVADRENSRVQIFSTGGELLKTWTDVIRPCEVFVASDDLVYVSELGCRTGLFPWMQPDASLPGGRLSIFNLSGELQARWGGGDDPKSPTDFYAPHDIQVDSQGNIYTAEVVASASSNATAGSSGCPTLRKFARC
jgi:hypothetical protein